jgi:hypothetical protein
LKALVESVLLLLLLGCSLLRSFVEILSPQLAVLVSSMPQQIF